MSSDEELMSTEAIESISEDQSPSAFNDSMENADFEAFSSRSSNLPSQENFLAESSVDLTSGIQDNSQDSQDVLSDTSEMINSQSSSQPPIVPHQKDSVKYKNITFPSTSVTDQSQGNQIGASMGNARIWFAQNDFKNFGRRLLKPALAFGALVALVLLLQVYTRVLNTIGHFPLAPRLFELTGIVWVVWFSSSRLIRTEDRQEFFSSLRFRFQKLLGIKENF